LELKSGKIVQQQSSDIKQVEVKVEESNQGEAK